MAKNAKLIEDQAILLKDVANNNPYTGIKSRWSPITKYSLFLGIITFCIYVNTLQNGYVLDDAAAIIDNKLVGQGISAIPEILLTPYHNGDIDKIFVYTGNDLYRPLSLVTFAVEYQLFKNSALPGHLINVLLYIGCVILFFLFLYHLFRKKRPVLAFISALLFAIHPIHTEIVANIKSRDELLCFLFGLLSMNAFVKYVDGKDVRSLTSGLIFYFLSLLSKETSLTFLAIIPLIFFFYRNEDRKRSIQIFLYCALPVLVYLFIRFSVLMHYNAYNPSYVTFYENPLVAAPSFASRLATAILVLGKYLKLLIIPYPLICDYSYNALPYANFGDPWVLLSILMYILLVF